MRCNFAVRRADIDNTTSWWHVRDHSPAHQCRANSIDVEGLYDLFGLRVKDSTNECDSGVIDYEDVSADEDHIASTLKRLLPKMSM